MQLSTSEYWFEDIPSDYERKDLYGAGDDEKISAADDILEKVGIEEGLTEEKARPDLDGIRKNMAKIRESFKGTETKEKTVIDEQNGKKVKTTFFGRGFEELEDDKE